MTFFFLGNRSTYLPRTPREKSYCRRIVDDRLLAFFISFPLRACGPPGGDNPYIIPLLGMDYHESPPANGDSDRNESRLAFGVIRIGNG